MFICLSIFLVTVRKISLLGALTYLLGLLLGTHKTKTFQTQSVRQGKYYVLCEYF
jgi:hypothetical protein